MAKNHFSILALRTPWTVWKSKRYDTERSMGAQYATGEEWRNSSSIGRDLDSGKDWRQEEKGMAENEMVGWHHQLERQEFEQAPRVGDGQGRLVCCSPWGLKELDTTEWLNWMKKYQRSLVAGAKQVREMTGNKGLFHGGFYRQELWALFWIEKTGFKFWKLILGIV